MSLLDALNRYRRWRDDRRYLRAVAEAEEVNHMVDDFTRAHLIDLGARGAARERARQLRHGDRRSEHWRPQDVELACEVFFGDDWWDDVHVMQRRSTFRTAMTDALNAAWGRREEALNSGPESA